jgi:hypothetical protein
MIRPMTRATRDRLQQHLRVMLDCPRLWLDEPAMARGSIELRIGNEVVGTVDEVFDEGERSWAVTIVVLEDELPPP